MGIKALSRLLRGEEHIGVITEPWFVVDALYELVRPANTTAYAALDTIADFADGTLVHAFKFPVARRKDDPFTIERIRLYTTDTGFKGIRVRGWIFRERPALVAGAGDNLKFSVALQTLVGTMTGTFLQHEDATAAISDGGLAIMVADAGSRIEMVPANGGRHFWMLIQTLDAATPSANSTRFSAKAEGFQGHA